MMTILHSAALFSFEEDLCDFKYTEDYYFYIGEVPTKSKTCVFVSNLCKVNILDIRIEVLKHSKF